MLKYGLISEVDYKNGRARVNFDDIGIVSAWLSLPKGKISDNRYYAVNTQVAVIMHDNGEDGEIIHEVPNDEDKPESWADADKEGVKFKDGTTIIYDNSTKELEIDAGLGEIIFKCTKLTVKGAIEADGEVTAMAITPVTKVNLSTHTHTAPTGVTGTPIPTP